MQTQIQFKERPIYQAPLAVLQHLYYYTTQYGLSVKQFTGAHWSYWEDLPKRLRQAQDNPTQLDTLIVELKELASGAEKRLQRRREQIAGKWTEKEVILNAQLLSVLAAFPERLIALGFRYFVGSDDVPRYLRIVDLEMRSEEGQPVFFVEPDLLLLGGNHLMMVELKTRGGSQSSRDYPPHQLLNYLHLVAKCRDSNDDSVPNQFTHVILVPSTKPKWLEKHTDWVLDTCDEKGRLRITPDACIELSKKKAAYDYEVLANLASEVPIYYRSWQQLHTAFDSAAQDYDDQRNCDHWRMIVDEIKELARRAGKYS